MADRGRNMNKNIRKNIVAIDGSPKDFNFVISLRVLASNNVKRGKLIS
jgi:hypothetical protein